MLVRSDRKFDIRQWILVTNTNPLTIYGFEECYIRVSGSPYNLESTDLSNKKVHLCNFAIQSAEEEGIVEPMMTQGDFDVFLQSTRGVSYFDCLLPTIKKASIQAIMATTDKLERVGNGFEWLGLDFMVTDSLDVKLLEVNVSPDISRSTSVTKRLVEQAARDLMQLILVEKGERDFSCSAASSSSFPPKFPAKSTCIDDKVSSELCDGEIDQPVLSDDTSETEKRTRLPCWVLWEKGTMKRKSELIEFSCRKSQICNMSLASTVSYGPRKIEMAERVYSILGIPLKSFQATSTEVPSAATTSTSVSSFSSSVKSTHTAPPPPNKPARVKRDEVHANIFAKKLNIAILGDAAKSDSSDEGEI